MLELLVCSLLTILPDYLFRRYVQGKRFGKEITFFSVWFELRWGITLCLMLTIGLITVIFYYHPSTTNVISYFRTVPIVPEINGRVAEIYIGMNDRVAKGASIFRLDSTKQEAAIETARRKIAVEGRKGAIAAATAAKQGAEAKISALLPAEKASAEAALAQAEADQAKTVIRAGVGGQVEQFSLRVGDIVNPFMRPAGVLIPEGAGQRSLQAGFGQIEGQVMKVGMAAEVTCVSKPMTIIPMVVTDVQDFIAAGQFRGGEQLVDPQQVTRPGTILVFLEPLYEGGLDGVLPGSSCIANAYTSNHDVIASKDISTMRRIVLHAVDAVGLVHAMILRIQALVLPIQTLVFSGH